MRKILSTAFIGLIALVFADQREERAEAFLPPRTPAAETGTTANRTPDNQAKAFPDSPQAPDASEASRSFATKAVGDKIERGATPARIRRILEDTLRRVQSTRPLDIAPSVIDRVAEQGHVRIIFDVLDPSGSDEPFALRDDPEAVQDFRIFSRLGYGAARLGPEALRQWIESGATGQIELDVIHRPTLSHSLAIIGADLAHQSEADGDGRVVAVLDTGIDSLHPMFAGRVVEEACFSVLGNCPDGGTRMFGPGAAAPCPQSQCSHGTHVAGIASGSDATLPLHGVAPHSQIIAIQIFSPVDDGIGAYGSDILAGLQHVLGLAPFYAIDVANLSFGGDNYASESDCDRAVGSQQRAVARLREVGIATVAASGNDSLPDHLSSPACLSNVIGVGATNPWDSVAGFSNSATFLSFLAPGQSILSARVGGGTRYSSGTSMAAPHFSGALAAIREAHPDATISEIENALSLTGTPILDPRNGETQPRIEVQAAINLLTATADDPPPADEEPGASGSNGSTAGAARAASGGGGGGCGLIGIEPFLILGLVRFSRRAPSRRKNEPDDSRPRRANHE